MNLRMGWNLKEAGIVSWVWNALDPGNLAALEYYAAEYSAERVYWVAVKKDYNDFYVDFISTGPWF